MGSRISAEKVLTYKDKLHSLLSNISAEENFIGSRWVKATKAGNFFIPACKNLGYVTIHYKSRKQPTYAAKLAPTSVEPIHGRNVYEEVSRLAGERTKKKGPEAVDIPSVLEPKLSFSDKELVDELRRRGYAGKLTKIETLEI